MKMDDDFGNLPDADERQEVLAREAIKRLIEDKVDPWWQDRREAELEFGRPLTDEEFEEWLDKQQ